MTKRIVALLMVLPFALAACQESGPKQTGGTLVGAGLGALAGSQIGQGTGNMAAIAIGTLLGNQIGKRLDCKDQSYHAETANQALETKPTGTTSTWVNPDTGHRGTVTPKRTYQDASGEYCREYQQTVTVGGKTQDAYGTACRQPDGTWKVVN